MSYTYKGVLIDQSVLNPRDILEKITVVGNRETSLEGEGFSVLYDAG